MTAGSFLFILGLCCGSFVNALVWRLHMQASQKSKAKSASWRKKLSVLNGRSMCPKCRHELAWFDLIPVLSWFVLKGKCRYCGKPISTQYPLVELLTGLLFLLSYLAWPLGNLLSYIDFSLWLTILTGLVALAVYDLKWMILPNKILAPLAVLSGGRVLLLLIDGQGTTVISAVLAALVGGGFFYVLYAISGGKWMGDGDFRLAVVMGLLLDLKLLLVALMLAFNTAAALSLALMLAKKLGRKSLIAFGPFLILGLVLARLYGGQLIDWYLSWVSIY